MNVQGSAEPRHRHTKSRLLPRLAVVVAAVLGAAGLTAIAAPALATPDMTGAISGQVQIQRAGLSPRNAQLDEVLVTPYLLDEDGTEATSDPDWAVTTQAGGVYTLPELPVGQYSFDFSYRGAGTNLVGGFTDGEYTLEEAIVDGNFIDYAEGDSEGPDFEVSLGAIVSGNVVDWDTESLEDQPVELWRSTYNDSGAYWDLMTQTSTDEVGDYLFTSLPTGLYALRAGGDDGWTAEWWDDVYVNTADDATSFDLAAGTDPVSASIHDFELVPGGGVSGKVTNTSNKTVAGIVVTPYRFNDDSGEFQPYDSAVTESGNNGTYAITDLPPGEYTVGFASPEFATLSYTPQFWSNVSEIDFADTFLVDPGSLKKNVNAKMVRAGSISGTISLTGGGFPAADDIQISACEAVEGFCGELGDSEIEGTASYDETTGAYTVTPLRAGDYVVIVRYLGTANFQTEWFGDAHRRTDATTIKVAASAGVTGKNIQLDPGFTVTGTARVDGDPADNVQITIYRTELDEFYPSYNAVKTTSTSGSGTYSFTGLGAGSYVVRADYEEDLDTVIAPQWYGGVYDSGKASKIAAAGTGTASGIDFALEAGATIQGAVTGAENGDPLVGFDVDLNGLKIGDYRLDETTTDEDGTYTLAGLPPGNYTVHVAEDPFDSVGDQHLDGYYGGDTVGDALTVTLTAGQVFDADVSLNLGGIYSGRIVDSDHNPIDAVSITGDGIDNPSTVSSFDGTFRLSGLRPGIHSLLIDGAGGSFIDNMTVDAPATTLNVAAVNLGDIVVEQGSTIDGVVIGIDGKALKNVSVGAWVRDSTTGGLKQYGYGTEVDAGGHFTLEALPTEPVYLYFSPWNGSYPAQYLGGGTDWAFSDPVVFSEEGSHAFREARLLTGGTVSGTVKNKATGRAIAGIPVIAIPQQEGAEYDTLGNSESNSKGAYSIPGLQPGSYQVTFNDRATGPGLAYSTEAVTAYVPDRTKVTVNASLVPGFAVSGIVRIAPSTPLKDAIVTAIPVGGGDPVTAVTDTTGSYSLRLLQGSWLVYAHDPAGQAGGVYFGGSASKTTATPVVVGTKAVTGRDITLPVPTGGIDVTTVVGDEDDDPSGTVTLERIEGGNPVSSYVVGPYEAIDWQPPLSRIFPITHLGDGTYRLTIDAISGGGDFGGRYPQKVVDDVVVSGGAVTTISSVDLGAPNLYDSSDVPKPTPGDKPVVLSDGTPQVGETLSVTDGTWNRAIDAFGYQWLRDGKRIPGATDSTYDIAPGDAGHHISVRVDATVIGLVEFFEGGFGSSTASLADEIEPGGAPNITDAPAIAGRLFVGQTLTASNGTWDLPGLKFSYQWRRDGVDIANAKASTYKLVTADVGQPISVHLTVTRAGFEPAEYTAPADSDIQPAVALKQSKPSKVTAVVDGFTVTSGTWTPAPTTLDYVWRDYDPVDGTYTEHPTGPTGALTDAGIRSGTERVTVVITASRSGYTTTSVEVPVRSGPTPSFSTAPVLSGSPQVGHPLTVDVSAASTVPETATYAYQWYRGTSLIKGATAASYTPLKADQGANLSVKVTLRATGYTATTTAQLTLAPVGPVAAVGVFTPGSPTISGVAAVGRTLTAVPGAWSPAATFGYVWLRDGAVVSKATKVTYTLTAADSGKEVMVRVTGSRDGYVKASADSLPVDVTTLALQTVSAPTLPNSAAVGTKLSVGTGTWDLTPSSYLYQWYVNGDAIPGATASSFTPRVTDLGEDLSVSVTARRSGFPDSASTPSNTVTVEPGAAAVASKAPGLSAGGKTVKSVKGGQTIATTGGTWPVTALDLQYQWQVDRHDSNGWVDLEDETSKTLYLNTDETPLSFDVGFSYRVVVNATRAGYDASPSVASGQLNLVG